MGQYLAWETGVKYLSRSITAVGPCCLILIGAIFLAGAAAAQSQATSAEEIDSASAEEQKQPSVLIEDGLAAFRAGDFENAYNLLLRGLPSFPNDLIAHYFAGIAALNIGKASEAKTLFQTSIEIDPEYLDAHYQLGILLVNEKKDYERAIKSLSRVYAKTPKRENLGFFLGLAHYELGQTSEALRYFNEGVAGDDDIRGLTSFYTGMIYLKQEQKEKALVAYQQVKSIDSASPWARESERIVASILAGKPPDEKPFRISLAYKIQSDTNVNLSPTEAITGVEPKRSGATSIIFLHGEYDIIRTNTWGLTGTYSLLDSEPHVAGVERIQDHTGGLGLSRAGLFGGRGVARLNGSFEFLSGDNQKRLVSYNVLPSFTFHTNRNNMTIVRYGLTSTNFSSDPANTADRRDNTLHEPGILHFIHSGDFAHYVQAGYTYAQQRAKGDNWDYHANRYVLGGQYSFARNLRLNAYVNYARIRYDNENNIFGVFRRDRQTDVSLILSRDLNDHFTLTVDGRFTRNNSNIDLYKYRKYVASGGITWSY